MAYYEHGRPELFDLLSLDESYDRVDWARVIARVRTHPHEASWFVPGSASTVHHGGYYGSLIEDGEEDDDDSTLVGWTALHTSMYVEPTAEAVEALLQAFPRAARMESSRGDTPLHFALFREIGPGVVRALLRAAPSALFARNNEGLTPLDVFCRWWANNVGEEDPGVADDEELDVPIGRGREWDQQWQKIEMMLRAAAVVRDAAAGDDDPPPEEARPSPGGSESGGSPRRRRRRRRRRGFRALHVASDLCCPPEILRHAHGRDAAQIRTRDERTGRLPLSIAAASSVISGKADGESRALLDELLALHPSAASASDAEGRLPLHLALESLLTWEGGIESILGAAPRVLRTRDVTSHLYPFMAAAVGGVGGMCADINTIYMLLRNGPEMAAGMADDPPWLRAEKRWEGRLEEQREAHRQEVGSLTRDLKAVTLERDVVEMELAGVRGSMEGLRDENAALRAELERMKEEMGILARIGEEMQREDGVFEPSTLSQKRRRKDTIG